MKSIFGNAKWIIPKKFQHLSPINVFHGEHEPFEIVLPEELKNLHILYRAEFNTDDITDVMMRISADDYYKLYINGHFVGQGPAQGYYFNYYYNEYDISGFLKRGKNQIFVDVYYQGLVNRAYDSGDRRLGLIASIICKGKFVFSTSEEWENTISEQYIKTHTLGYDTMFAENIDFRIKNPPYEKSAFITPDYTFAKTPAVSLSVYSKAPKSKRPIEDGYLYDFGEEITGGIYIKCSAAAGAKIRILCGEELCDDGGRVRFNMRCNCSCDEFIICAEGELSHTQYEYKGFRYAEILTEGDVEIIELLANVRHYPFDDNHCKLITDNEILKSVWDICKNGVKYGSQEAYVDCPTREKGQYSGDMVITSSAHIILTSDTRLLKKAMDDLAMTASFCEGLLAVTPGSFMQEISDYSLQYPILALRYYDYTGDRQYLAQNLEICEHVISYFKKYAREDGLLSDVTGKWNLVDWPANLRDGYDFPLKRPMDEGAGAHNVINAFYIGCILGTEKIKDILGIKHKEEGLRLIEAFNREFFDEEQGLYTDSKKSTHASLHSNVIPLFYGISTGKNEEKIAEFIIKKKLCCGVYMAYFMLKALCRVGKEEDALALICSEEENSWYNMVKEGATTCFEAWGKEQKWNTSLCHPWACAPISVLYEDILPKMPHVGRIVFNK